MAQVAELLSEPEKVSKPTIMESQLKIGAPQKMSPEKNETEFPKLTTSKPVIAGKQDGGLRMLSILLILVLIGSGTLGFFFYREYDLRQQTLNRLSQTESEKTILEQSIAQLKSDVRQQKEELEKLAVDLKSANEKAALVDSMRETQQKEIESITQTYESQIQSLRKALESRNGMIKSLESNLNNLRKLTGLQAEDASKMAVAGDRNLRQPAEQNVVLKAPTSPKSGGKIVSVDQLHRFVIINLGQAEGADVGRFVQIYQNGKVLGSARIERTYQTLSAATILSDDTLNRVQTGDQVYLTLA